MHADIKYEKNEELLFDEIKPVLELRIVWPILGGNVSKRTETNFNAFYYENAKTANKFARTELFQRSKASCADSQRSGFPFTVHSFIRETKIPYSDCKHISAVTETYLFTGGAHGVTTRFARTWDIETGTCIALKNFFRRGFNYRKYIVSSIIRQIEQLTDEEKNSLYPNATYLAAKNFSAAGWYLSGINEICVFYPEYVIAPHMAGIVEFKIPMIK